MTPRFPGVMTDINPISETDVPPTIVLARPKPDGRVGCGVDGNTTHAVRRLVVKNRLEGGPCVCRFPEASGSYRYVPGIRLNGVNRNITDTARHEGRSNTAKLQCTRNQLGSCVRIRFRVLFCGRNVPLCFLSEQTGRRTQHAGDEDRNDQTVDQT